MLIFSKLNVFLVIKTVKIVLDLNKQIVLIVQLVEQKINLINVFVTMDLQKTKQENVYVLIHWQFFQTELVKTQFHYVELINKIVSQKILQKQLKDLVHARQVWLKSKENVKHVNWIKFIILKRVSANVILKQTHIKANVLYVLQINSLIREQGCVIVQNTLKKHRLKSALNALIKLFIKEEVFVDVYLIIISIKMGSVKNVQKKLIILLVNNLFITLISLELWAGKKYFD